MRIFVFYGYKNTAAARAAARGLTDGHQAEGMCVYDHGVGYVWWLHDTDGAIARRYDGILGEGGIRYVEKSPGELSSAIARRLIAISTK